METGGISSFQIIGSDVSTSKASNLTKPKQICNYCFGIFLYDCVHNPELTSNGIECKNYDDECFTFAQGDQVVRGCLQDHYHLVDEHFDCSDSDSCQRCSDKPFCNNIPIEQNTCYQCNSTENEACFRNPNFQAEKLCPYSFEQRCYHLNDDKADFVERGCVSTLTKEQKERCSIENGCIVCNGTACNQLRLEVFAKCYECNTTTTEVSNMDCLFHPEKAEVKLCKQVDDTCYSMVKDKVFSRGCSSDVSEEDLKQYSLHSVVVPTFRHFCRENPELCSACTPNRTVKLCNTQTLGLGACIHCHSSEDMRCRLHTQYLDTNICSLGDLCYTKYEEDNVLRGCVSDLDESEQKNCLMQTDTCKTCKGYECNRKASFQRCSYCSSDTDPDCLNGTSLHTTELCQNYMAECIVGIDEKGFTHRRCAANDRARDNVQFLNGYKLCSGIGCNNCIFPEDRARCHHCNGEPWCNFLEDDDKELYPVKPCERFSYYDQCYTYIDRGELMLATCLISFLFYFQFFLFISFPHTSMLRAKYVSRLLD